jgi:hypothetical protein
LRPVVALGQVSYSLYLWHYPILVFAHYYGIDTTRPLPFALCMGIIVGLAALSYFLIEGPVRFGVRSRVKQNATAVALLASSGLLAAISFGIDTSGGLTGRGNLAGLPADYFANAGKIERFTSGIDGRRCTQGCTALSPDGAETTWLLVGDSHANDFRDEVLAAARDAGVKLDYLIIPNCTYSAENCPQGLARLQRLLADDTPERVFFVSALVGTDRSFAYHLRSDTATVLAGVLNSGAEVDYFLSRPRFEVDPIRMAVTGRREEIALDPSWRAENAAGDPEADTLAASYTRFRIVDQPAILATAGCGALDCFDGHDSAGLPLYRDTNHLTEYGAARVMQVLRAEP